MQVKITKLYPEFTKPNLYELMYFVKIFLNSPWGGLEARRALGLLNLKTISSRVCAEGCFRNSLMYLSILWGFFLLHIF